MAAPTFQPVFLSYASQDADAARAIAEALRAAGVEVWFDQNELVGGDAWDAKIRRQIAECALFVPIISAATQARREGYFRLEWKLAAQRTHMIADGTPFLLPVVIDDTRDTEALAPGEFKAVQWTRLGLEKTGAQASGQSHLAAFSTRVIGLLRGMDSTANREPARSLPSRALLDEIPRSGARRFRMALAIAGAAAVSIVVWWWQARPGSVSTPGAASPGIRAGAAMAPRLGPKSIAVLPFENRSDEPNASAFFAEGMHEDIITSLLLIRDLRCVPRATAMAYRDSRKSLREIADELGVAVVLTGTVRRAQTAVRITGTLINPRTDETLWSKRYDQELTDVFAIQAALAQEIALALRATLSPGEKNSLQRRPTENLAAYELVLKARELRNAFVTGGPSSRSSWREMEPLLQSAVRLDPNYAGAHAELASVWIGLGGEENLESAKAAIDRAERLDPDAVEIRLARGDYFNATGDRERALAEFGKVAQLRPNEAGAYERIGAIERGQGRRREALANLLKAKEIDPGNLRNRQNLVLLLLSGRRYGESLAEQRYIVSRIPDNREAAFFLAHVAHLATGSTRELEDALRRFQEPMSRAWAIRLGRLDEAARLEGVAPDATPAAKDADALQLATAHAARGAGDAARSLLGGMPERLRGQGRINWAVLGFVEALMGRKEEARRCARQAEAEAAGKPNPALARLHAWIDEKEAALAAYAALLPPTPMSGTPGGLNVHVMKNHPDFFPLRGDPRFEALLNDPKNNAPLF